MLYVRRQTDVSTYMSYGDAGADGEDDDKGEWHRGDGQVRREVPTCST